LALDTRTIVFIISGRSQAFLEEQLGSIPNIGISAEHGYFLRMPGSSSWIETHPSCDVSWKEHVFPVLEGFTADTPGSFIEDKLASVTWHYRLADQVAGERQAAACHKAILASVPQDLSIEIINGKKNLEVRPLHANKGLVVERILKIYDNVDFILCCGDDRTDEDMFAWIANNASDKRHDVLCIVNSGGSSVPRSTVATYSVGSVRETQDLLESLAISGPKCPAL
jgi:trehalose 6-phosphate synthase/phosphatase